MGFVNSKNTSPVCETLDISAVRFLTSSDTKSKLISIKKPESPREVSDRAASPVK